jgi:hypothetical protein
LYPVLALMAFSPVLPAQGQNQIAGLGFSNSLQTQLPTVFPGELVTLFTAPLGVPAAVATQLPLPNTLSGVSVLVRVSGAMDATGYPTSLPIFRIDNISLGALPQGTGCSLVTGPTPLLCSYSQITVEIPVDAVCALTLPDWLAGETTCSQPFHNVPPMLVLNVKANGVTGPDMPVQTGGVGHFLDSCDSIFGPHPSSTCQQLVTHADGSLVSDSSPAKVGETITLWAPGETNAPTGYAPTAATGVTNLGLIEFSYPASGSVFMVSPGSSTTAQTIVNADWWGTVPGYIGLAQINVTVPPRPNGSYQCGGYTYANQPGNAQILFPGYPDSAFNICIQP